MEEVKIKEGRGFVEIPDGGVITFEVRGLSERAELKSKEYESIYSRYITENMTMQLDDFIVPLWGESHNLYPQEVFSTTSENKLLPELIKKQVKFLFGKGPRLYREVIEGEGEKQRRVRIPVEMREVTEWLESWEETTGEHYWDYLKNLITDYYYVNTCCTKYYFTAARRLHLTPVPSPQGEGRKPLKTPSGGRFKGICALGYVGSDEARLATREKSLTKRIKNRDCEYVIVGDWMNPNKYEYEVYHRFDAAAPFKYPVAIAFNSDKTFSKWMYAFNDWFRGLLEWIRASNLSPRYLNSYLKNALNAHVHVIIPGSWYHAQKDILQNICNENLTGEAPVQLEYKGVRLVGDDKRVIPFYEGMVEQAVIHELKKISELMSGEGKNQGKLWASTRWGEKDGWEFQEFPGKFQEYFKSVIDYDKRADQVILAGKGIASSITNVENDGVISKSGSDVYYNYLIYVASLTLDEYFVMKEINRAIHLNFPEAKRQGVRLGFWIDIPSKLQETSPGDRPNQTATADVKGELRNNEEQKSIEN
jgi:hypothetical protein